MIERAAWGWRISWCLACLAGLALASPALLAAEPPPAGLAIDELYLDPAGGAGFIELVQLEPSTVLTLDGFYLATSPDYPALVTGQAPAEGILVALPEAVFLAPGERYVIALGSTQAFVERFGQPPQVSLAELGAGAPPFPDPAPGGFVALFWWDGTSDRVLDADLVRFGDAPGVDKTGLALDGPDEDTLATPYGPDTPLGQQEPVGAPGERALTRIGGESGEARREDANGLGGHDETSERWPAAFEATLTPTPGAPGLVAFELRGEVHAASDGAPIGGAAVRLLEPGLETHTDDAGAFALAPVPRGVWTLEVAGAGQGAPSALFGVAVERDTPALSLELGDTAVLRGRIGLAGVAPPALAGTRISAPSHGVEAISDGDGDFVLGGLPLGPARVEVRREGWLGQAIELDARDGARLELELRPALGHHVTVQLRASDGVLPAGTRIELRRLGRPPLDGLADRYAVQSERDGEPRLELTGVLDGTYALTLEAAGFVPSRLEPLVIDGEVALVLEPIPVLRADEPGTVAVGCAQVRGAGGGAGGWLVALAALVSGLLGLERRRAAAKADVGRAA